MPDLFDLVANPTRASDPLDVRCSWDKLFDLGAVPRPLRWLARLLPNWRDYHENVSLHLTRNDSRAAIVVDTRPLLVAAYGSDLDCVAVLQFPPFLIERYELSVGSRLVTSNGYWNEKKPAKDLILGPGHTGDWTHFYPMIADFLTDEVDVVEARKAEIEDSEWQRCVDAAAEHLSANMPRRLGEPCYSDLPM